MLTLFARNISKSKDWCSYWEMNKHGQPAPEDYRSDKEFWYNLNANFDVLSAAWRLAAWTGDSSYYMAPAFRAFGRASVGPYIRSWVLQPDALLTRPAHPNAPVPYNDQDAFDRCRGLPSYSEGIPNMKLGVDLIAALYRGMMTWSDIQRRQGNASSASEFARRAEQYRVRLEKDWWSDSLGRYFTWYSNDGQFGISEGETFLLWFDALHDTAHVRRTIDHLASVRWNVENTSYLPYIFYREGFPDTARRTILYLADPSTGRREYPEVSFGVVQGIVLGLMGVDPLPGTRTVTTLHRVTAAHGPAHTAAKDPAHPRALRTRCFLARRPPHPRHNPHNQTYRYPPILPLQHWPPPHHLARHLHRNPHPRHRRLPHRHLKTPKR
ncbi:hypothetical protein ACQ86N_03575 [Puia sp. P3]|uniref:hypothetical protein n=1 Tax=Puia sp. P3 TaxID=3423952 RepID=UPI003D67AA3B